MSRGPPAGKGTGSGHGDRPRPWPSPGGDRSWAENPPRQVQAPPQPSEVTAPGDTGRGSFARRALSALALLVGGLLIALGVFALAASVFDKSQKGGGAAEAGVLCLLLAAPFVIVGVKGWQRRGPKPDLSASSRVPATPTAPEAGVQRYERPLPFPPHSAPRAAPQEAQRKTCPDCAETVLAAAKVCRYCGYRFEPATAPRASD